MVMRWVVGGGCLDPGIRVLRLRKRLRVVGASVRSSNVAFNKGTSRTNISRTGIGIGGT